MNLSYRVHHCTCSGPCYWCLTPETVIAGALATGLVLDRATETAGISQRYRPRLIEMCWARFRAQKSTGHKISRDRTLVHNAIRESTITSLHRVTHPKLLSELSQVVAVEHANDLLTHSIHVLMDRMVVSDLHSEF